MKDLRLRASKIISPLPSLVIFLPIKIIDDQIYYLYFSFYKQVGHQSRVVIYSGSIEQYLYHIDNKTEIYL